jgi:hypothetical protein
MDLKRELFILTVLFVFYIVESNVGNHHEKRHRHHRAIDGYELSALNDHVKAHIATLVDKKDPITGKYIPRLGWIAVRNSSDARAAHMTGPNGFVARNTHWKLHFCGNEEKDRFMEITFSNTSLLWAYNILNPAIGTAKAEIWRLAVLYYYGGMYLDDDANIATPLDNIIQPEDKFIVGKEGYNWTDNCYTDDYPLSNASLNLRFGKLNQQEFFNNRYFFNWALFSMPGNPLVYRILEHVIALIKYEYLGESKIKMSPQDHRGEICCLASLFYVVALHFICYIDLN